MECAEEKLVFTALKPAVKPLYKAPTRVFKRARHLEPTLVKKVAITGYGDIEIMRQVYFKQGVTYTGYDLFNEDGVQLNEQPYPEKPTKTEIKSLLINMEVKETEAELWTPPPAPVMVKVKCAQDGCATKVEVLKEQANIKHWCKDCRVWLKRASLAKYRSIRYKGRHYTEGGSVLHGIRGSGGEVFRIKFKDGHELETSDLWPNGDVPKRFKSKLPDNVKQFESADQKMRDRMNA